MVINSFLYFLLFCAVSLALCVTGCVIAFFFQSDQIARELLTSWVFYFNGILVGGSGYGLMWYIKKEGKNLMGMLNNLIEVNNLKDMEVVVQARRGNSWLWKNIIGIPITIVGGAIMWYSGYPLTGFAKYYLAICSISIYYVGSYIFTFFVFSILMFKAIEENLKNSNICKKTSVIEYETINNFFAITATVGIFAIYFGFRGTLTANFQNVAFQEIIKKSLILPVVLFVPITLVYSFYPRYVLKKLFDCEIIGQIQKLESLKEESLNGTISIKEKLEIEKTISDVKEKLMAERKQLPILTYKDSPSLALVIMMVLQLIVQYDKVIGDFFKLF